MKTLIKAYYRDPKVDSKLIMKTLFEQKKEHSRGLFFVPGIAVAGLLIGFLSFLMDLNIEFFSTALSLYFAIGWVLFFFLNLVIGISLFIVSHHELLIIISCLAFGLEMGIFSRLKIQGTMHAFTRNS